MRGDVLNESTGAGGMRFPRELSTDGGHDSADALQVRQKPTPLSYSIAHRFECFRFDRGRAK